MKFNPGLLQAGISSKQTELLTEKPLVSSSNKGLQEGWMRATFILKIEHIEQIKLLARANRMTIKKFLNVVLAKYLTTQPSASIPIPQNKN